MEPPLEKNDPIKLAFIRGRNDDIDLNPVEKVQDDAVHGGFNLIELTFKAWNNDKIKSQVEALHGNKIPCFVNVEINAKIEVIKVSTETDFKQYSEKADSPKLITYQKAELKFKIPVLIWSKEPNASYVSLLLKPWLSSDDIKSVTTDLKHFSLISHFCASCGNPDPEKKCPCGSVKYCNSNCQKLDWKKHKLQCNYKK